MRVGSFGPMPVSTPGPIQRMPVPVPVKRFVIPVSSQHTVQPGQTIQQIGQMHGVAPADIQNHPLNRHVTYAGPLAPGTRLFLPPKPMQVI